MKKPSRLVLSALTVALFAPLPTFAHQIGGNGVLSGITHPLFGLDHLLAMVAVGVLATQYGGRVVWQVPVRFLVGMILGGILGIVGIGLPGAELAIAFSVLLLGMLIALQRLDWQTQLSFAVVLFGLFHGHAHGVEMPQISQPALYVLGFVGSTAVLHLSGVTLGLLIKRSLQPALAFRLSGLALSLVGIGLLVG